MLRLDTMEKHKKYFRKVFSNRRYNENKLTHRIASDQHSRIGSLPLVKAGVMNYPLSGQSEWLHIKNKEHFKIKADKPKKKPKGGNPL